MVILYEHMLRNINQRKKMNNLSTLLLSVLGFVIGYGGAMRLLKWSIGKDLVITWKPFSVKIEER